MKKSAILLAGAVAFDLGIMVVPVHAADSTNYLKVEGTRPHESLSLNFIKIDNTNTASACTGKGGKLVQHNGFPSCQLPNTHR